MVSKLVVCFLIATCWLESLNARNIVRKFDDTPANVPQNTIFSNDIPSENKPSITDILENNLNNIVNSDDNYAIDNSENNDYNYGIDNSENKINNTNYFEVTEKEAPVTIVALTEEDIFGLELRDLLSREVERVNDLDILVQKYKFEHKSGSLQVKYKLPIANALKQLQKELANYYINLIEQSLKTNVLPNRDENMFEVKALELLPKYLDQMYRDMMKEVLSEPNLKASYKATITRESKVIFNYAKVICELIRLEILGNTLIWKQIDPFLIIVQKKLPLDDNATEDEKQAYERIQNIFSDFTDLISDSFEELNAAIQSNYDILLIE